MYGALVIFLLCKSAVKANGTSCHGSVNVGKIYFVFDGDLCFEVLTELMDAVQELPFFIGFPHSSPPTLKTFCQNFSVTDLIANKRVQHLFRQFSLY